MLIIPFILDTFEGLYIYLKKVYGLRPFSFKVADEDIKNKRYYFVQDADGGQSSGELKYVYEGTYYKRFINRIKKAGVGLMMITDRPAQKLLKDLENSRLYNDNKLIIANGGACVYEYDEKKKKYFLRSDTKISSDSVREIQNALGDLNQKSPMGALILNTKRNEYVYLKNASLFEKIKTIFKLKNRHILDSSGFSGLQNEVRNLSFDFFPQYKLNISLDKKDVQSKFWNRILKKRLGIKKQTNLPQFRELFLKRKSTEKDEINQFDVAKKVLEKLICYDKNHKDPKYIDELCVTFSTKGLEFVPKNCSKMSSLYGWWDESKKGDVRDFIVSGDNYNDFFAPVPLRELRDTYIKMLKVNENGKEYKIDLLEEFLNLSKPDNGIKYEDLAKIAYRYNVKDNSVSSYFLSEKFKEVAKAADSEMQEKKDIEAKLQILNEMDEDLDSQIVTLKNNFVHNNIIEEDYNEQYNKLKNFKEAIKLRRDKEDIVEGGKTEEEFNNDCTSLGVDPNAFQKVDEAKGEPLTDDEKYNGECHSGKHGHNQENYVKKLFTR